MISSTPAKKMRPVFAVLLGIVGLSLVSREVEARSLAESPEPLPQSGAGPLGHFATSLCTELIIPANYNCIEHKAVTDDGFILGLQNLPSVRGLGKPESCGPAVLLQHGLTGGGDNWVINSPQESLAFILADAGFDVWITNTRAVQWSHGHEYLNTSENAYWAWTYDELASYDFKASTEFVYKFRGGKKLSYIGHSLVRTELLRCPLATEIDVKLQGTTILLAGLTQGRFASTIRGYLNAAVMLAPFAYSTNLTGPAIQAAFIAGNNPLIYPAGAMESSSYAQTQLACTLPGFNANDSLCYATFSTILGSNSYTNVSNLGRFFQYYPQPTSTYNINHLGQGYNRSNFAFYDKGTKDNIALYGQATAPNYDLTKFPASLPLQSWSGGIDDVADPTDVEKMLAMVPSTKREDFKLPTYGHADFILGLNAHYDIYPTIIKFLKKHK